MAFKWQTERHRYRKYFTTLGQFYQQKKTRAYAGIILSLVTISFFLLFAIKPTLMTITQLTKQIKDQKEIVKKLQAKINALQEAQNEYTLVEDSLYLIDQALPENSQVSTLVKEVEALTRYSNVDLKTIRYGQAPLLGKASMVNSKGKKEEKKTKTNQIPSVNFTLALTGNYQNLKKFLQAFSSLRRTLLVESFIFKAAEIWGDEQLLVLSLNAQAYYLKPDKK